MHSKEVSVNDENNDLYVNHQDIKILIGKQKEKFNKKMKKKKDLKKFLRPPKTE